MSGSLTSKQVLLVLRRSDAGSQSRKGSKRSHSSAGLSFETSQRASEMTAPHPGCILCVPCLTYTVGGRQPEARSSLDSSPQGSLVFVCSRELACRRTGLQTQFDCQFQNPAHEYMPSRPATAADSTASGPGNALDDPSFLVCLRTDRGMSGRITVSTEHSPADTALPSLVFDLSLSCVKSSCGVSAPHTAVPPVQRRVLHHRHPPFVSRSREHARSRRIHGSNCPFVMAVHNVQTTSNIERLTGEFQGSSSHTTIRNIAVARDTAWA